MKSYQNNDYSYGLAKKRLQIRMWIKNIFWAAIGALIYSYIQLIINLI